MSAINALIGAVLDALEADPELLARLRTVLVPAAAAPDEWVPLRAAGVSPRTLRAAIKAGDLPASKVGREYRVRRSELSAWMAGRVVTPKVPAQSPAERAIARAAAKGALRVVGGRG